MQCYCLLLICQGPLLADVLKYSFAWRTLHPPGRWTEGSCKNNWKVFPAAWVYENCAYQEVCLLCCAVLPSHSWPVWVLCVCVIKHCLSGAVWLILMLEMMLYIRHQAIHIPLISLHGFRARTCATGICFLFGPALLCYGKRRGNSQVRGEGDWTDTDEQMRQNHLIQTTVKCLFYLILLFCCEFSRWSNKILHHVAILESTVLSCRYCSKCLIVKAALN